MYDIELCLLESGIDCISLYLFEFELYVFEFGLTIFEFAVYLLELGIQPFEFGLHLLNLRLKRCRYSVTSWAWHPFKRKLFDV